MPLFHIRIKKVVTRTMFAAMALAGNVGLVNSSRVVYAQTSSPSRSCATNAVLVTLAGEQISFCAPSAFKFNVVEDNASDQYSSYAALNQLSSYAYVNIKSTTSGHAPGIGRPIYQTGQIDNYRQEVLNSESAKTDRAIRLGPIGQFWRNSVSGVEMQTSLTTGTDKVQVASVEWNIEHGGRLWTFVIAWDAHLANAAEWYAAAQKFVIASPDSSGLHDTALDLGQTRSMTNTQIQSAPVDVGAPPWWNGTCNDGNYFPAMGLHAFPLGGAWHNVVACGPRPAYTSGNPDHLVHFYSGAWGAYEFECVELVLRFFYLEWSIKPFPGNGNTLKDYLPSSITFFPNGNHSIVPGDAITENGSQVNSFGHTAVVTAVNLDGNGNGSINIIEQNDSSTGSRSLSVTNWTINPDGSGVYQQTIQGWLHANSNPLHKDTVGVFRNGTFYLRNANGGTDTFFAFNPAGKPYPIVGDWTGIGIDTVGVYDQNNGLFSLRNTNTAGVPDEQFVLGVPNDQPIVGRWSASLTHDGTGIFRPSNGLIYLRNTLTTGYADETMVLGIPGDIGMAGDWTNQGFSSPGVYRSSNQTMYLSNQVCNCAVYADITFNYSAGPNTLPLVGDWTASGQVGVGLFTAGAFYLRNTLTTGPADIAFAYGISGDFPVAGHWTGGIVPLPPPSIIVPTSAPVPTQTAPSSGLSD
ncbi:MAG: CHAP domain-containing protein [Aggregatilineales bacterium]